MVLRSRLRKALARKPSADMGNHKVGSKATGRAEKPSSPPPAPRKHPAREIGGVKGPDPTRYGDWQHNGRCSDF